MSSKKPLVVGGVIAALAAAALLVPSLALGQPLGGILPVGPSAVATDADHGRGDGQGKAWGHHKDSPDFPGQGHGHDKQSKDFPGQDRGHDKND